MESSKIRIMEPFEFGRTMRKEFYMDSSLIQVNHGSYGTYPKVVGIALNNYQVEFEQNPDLWLRKRVKIELENVRNLLGSLINADSSDIVMVPNTTSAITAILRSIRFQPGERILHFNTTLGGIKNAIKYIVDSNGGVVSTVVFNATFPMNNTNFVSKFNNFLDKVHDAQKPIRIAIVDHISSAPAVVAPINQLIPLLKRRSILVLIDGAHAIGQVPIDIPSLDPDYYVTNCHKWLFAARGCAVLYVKKCYQEGLHPAIVNAGYKTNFQEEFFWTGTMSYCQYLTVPAAIQFRQDCGGEEVIRAYNHNLATTGGKLMAEMFNTRVLQELDQISSMVDVQLPVANPEDPTINAFDWWVDEQLNKHPGIFCPVHKHNGVWWARVSAQIYNDISDFIKAGEHFLKICEKINSSAK